MYWNTNYYNWMVYKMNKEKKCVYNISTDDDIKECGKNASHKATFEDDMEPKFSDYFCGLHASKIKDCDNLKKLKRIKQKRKQVHLQENGLCAFWVVVLLCVANVVIMKDLISIIIGIIIIMVAYLIYKLIKIEEKIGK